jgi:hypothetical protein
VEECRKCCTERHFTSWGQDPQDGEQGLNAVRYSLPPTHPQHIDYEEHYGRD